MTQAEYERLKRRIQEEYHANLEALERVWKMAAKSGAGEGDSPAARHKKGRLKEAVREAVTGLQDGFTATDVIDVLQKLYPDLDTSHASVSSTLRRLTESGDIALIQEGSGQRAGTYRRCAKGEAA